jgi:hypothetical protein
MALEIMRTRLPDDRLEALSLRCCADSACHIYAPGAVCRELRDGKRRDCKHRQVTSLQQAQVDDGNTAKLASARQHVIALRQQQHTSLQRQYDKQLVTAAQQAALESTVLLSTKQRAAARRRQQEETQRTQHATAAYRPFSGSGHTTMQARLQALAAGQELYP